MQGVCCVMLLHFTNSKSLRGAPILLMQLRSIIPVFPLYFSMRSILGFDTFWAVLSLLSSKVSANLQKGFCAENINNWRQEQALLYFTRIWFVLIDLFGKLNSIPKMHFTKAVSIHCVIRYDLIRARKS